MNNNSKVHSSFKVTMARSIGALSVAATLILPAISASAHEWERERQGPPYGWAKGHDKWKAKNKHHEHEWEHRRPRDWARWPVEQRYGSHYRPYYYDRPPPHVIYRPGPYGYRYPRDRWQQEIEKRRTTLSNARDEVRQGRQQLQQHKEELKKDRAELRRDIRNHASKAEIRQDRQEIRQDRQNIAATRKEVRRDRATLRSTR